MKKLYYGQKSETGEVKILVYCFNDRVLKKQYELKHIVKHSPTGLNFGYGGSGPADLALSILTDFLGNPSLAELAYQEFKSEFIAGVKHIFSLTGQEIRSWLEEHYPQIRIPMEAR